MNATEIRASCEWGWDRYERTGWRDKDGRRIYIGHFRSIDGPRGFSLCRITFAARHPVLAMRAMVESGRDPLEFHDTAIN